MVRIIPSLTLFFSIFFFTNNLLEGLKSAFGAGHQAGKAVLNGVRGVLNSGSITGINKDAKVGYWGYSGGSIATGWAALLQPTYASDLEENSVGFAYGGIVADVEATANTNMGTLTAGLIFAAINGLSADYPELNDYVNSHVFPNKLDEFRNPTKECLLPVLLNFAGQSWDDYFVDGDNTLNDPVVKNVTSQNSMITSSLVPTSPLFFYNSIGDEIITATQADKLYSRLCAAGVSIQYNQDLIGEHITQQALGAGDALVWLEDRLNGKAAPSGYKKNEAFSNALNWNGITGLGQVFASALARILFVPLGPYDYLG